MGNRFQSGNVDDALRAQGIEAGDAVVYFQDLSADLGGRIVPDNVWFYAALRDQHNKRTLPGYWASPGTGGVYGAAGSVPGKTLGINRNETVKFSYQANPNHRFSGFFIGNGITAQSLSNSLTGSVNQQVQAATHTWCTCVQQSTIDSANNDPGHRQLPV